MNFNKLFLLTTIAIASFSHAAEEEFVLAAAPKLAQEHPVLNAFRNNQQATVRGWLTHTELQIADLFPNQDVELKAIEIYNPRLQAIQVTGSINGTPAVFFFNKDGSYRSFSLPGVRDSKLGFQKRDLKTKTIIEEEEEGE